MKKFFIITAVVAFVIIALYTCSGGVTETTTVTETIEPYNKTNKKDYKDINLDVAQTVVKGNLKGCYEVVDKKYRARPDDMGDYMISVELLRTNKKLPYDCRDVTIFPEADKSSATYCAGFGIEILDEYGDVLLKKNPNDTPYSWSDMSAMLQLTSEDTATLRFKFYDEIPEEATSFRITSLVQINEKSMNALAAECYYELELQSEDYCYDDDDYEATELQALRELSEEALNISKKGYRYDVDDDDDDDYDDYYEDVERLEEALELYDKALNISEKVYSYDEDDYYEAYARAYLNATEDLMDVIGW